MLHRPLILRKHPELGIQVPEVVVRRGKNGQLIRYPVVEPILKLLVDSALVKQDVGIAASVGNADLQGVGASDVREGRPVA